ncbi:MAG: OmpA family protein [Flavobacteriaceae bacterium]|nr:OmpA family protein [Flavobacteriaceae bacterium]
MKKIISAILLVAVVFGVQAQKKQEYNRWSIDGKFGMNRPVRSVSMSTGYETASPLSPFVAGLGVRYMLNEKFGIRLGADYNSFKNGNDSKKFNSKSLEVNVQGVANLGNILSFDTWTKSFGLLSHAGVGIGVLRGDGFDGNDRFGSVDLGLTPQLKVSDKVSVFLDLSLQMTVKQDYNFDTFGLNDNIGFQGFNYMATLGVNFYLGGKEKHADWFYGMSKEEELELRLNNLEAKVDGLAKDVVSNKKAIKDNTIAIAGLKDKSNDFALKTDLANTSSNVKTDVARELINGGYINVYFGFNKSQPNAYSLWAVDFVKEYIKKNPNTTVEVIGYADEIGTDNYNQRLSDKRANVVKALIEKVGISASKVYAKGNGEDKSVDKNSENARQMARRVTFRVK